MNFQDIVEKNNQQLEVLNKLEMLIENVQVAKRQLELGYEIPYTASISNSFTGVYDKVVASNNTLRENLIGIEEYNLGLIINEFKQLYNNNILNLLINNIETSYQEISRIKKIFPKTNPAAEYKNCINTLNIIIDSFEKTKIIISYINSVNIDLSKGIKQPSLKIRSYVEEITDEGFNSIIRPINKIYDQLCIAANIKGEPIEIVRVESGTITINFNGNGKISEVIEKILSKLYQIYIRNFTSQGKKLNIAESVDAVKSEIEVIEMMDAAGIDTTELKELSRESMTIIIKETNILLTANPDIKINEKVLKRSEDIKALISKPVYLNEKKDEENIEE